MRKVLLVCLDNVGDLVFTSALAEALHADPNIELSLWCKDYTARLGHLLPGVQHVFAADPFWDRAPGRSKGSWRHFVRALRTIRKSHIDCALIPSSCWKTAMFIRLAGIPIRVGLRGRKNRSFLSTSVAAPSRSKPVVQSLLQSFQDFLPAGAAPRVRLDHNRLPALQLPEVLQRRAFVCIHAFAGRRDRCAPLELIAGLARKINDQGLSILWLGTPKELAEVRSYPLALEHSYFADDWAQDLATIAWLISHARAFIGHDSGPLHIATALAIPVLGFYLPGEPERTYPQGQAAAVMVVRDRPQLLEASVAEEAWSQLQKLAEVNAGEAALLRL